MSDPDQSGQGGASAGTSDFNAARFLIKQALARVNTIEPVEVLAVSPGNSDGQDVPAGTVDILPLVKLMDGAGLTMPVGPIYAVPYWRNQAGGNAIIIDPQVGDIGIAAYCQRDISAAVVAHGVAPPGSRRRFDRADGLYLGSYFSKKNPTQFIAFRAEGIFIVTPGDLNLTVAGNVVANIIGNSTETIGGTATIDAAEIVLAGGGPPIARVGDEVEVGGVTGTIITGSPKVQSG